MYKNIQATFINPQAKEKQNKLIIKPDMVVDTVIPTLEKLRQEDYHEFHTSLETDVVVYACNPSYQEAEEEDCYTFEGSLDYKVSLGPT